MSKMKIDPAKMMDKMDNICKNMMNMMDKMDKMYKNMMILDNMNNIYKNMTMLMDNMNNMYKNMTMMMNNINNTYNNMMGNNIGMGNNMGMNMGMGNNIPNFENNDWMKGLKMAMNKENQLQKDCSKISVYFATNQGKVTPMVFKYGTTVREALKLYLERVGRPDLIDTEYKIWFIYSASKLEFTDNRKIEDVFIIGTGGDIIVVENW